MPTCARPRSACCAHAPPAACSATAALAVVGPGDLALAVAAIVLSNIFYSYGESLIAAFLPELARREAMGRVSGWGWSFGYFGGMLTLGPEPGLRDVGAGAGHAGAAVRAGDDADHRRRLRRWRRWPPSRC